MERNENGLSALFPRRTAEATQPEGCSNRELNGTKQLAMVYSPMQCWRMLHTPEDALTKGTLFEELYKPYEEVW